MGTSTPFKILPQIEALEKEIQEKKKQLVELRRQQPGRAVKDYTFLGHDGREVSLFSLFGDRTELMVVHNMGKQCSYCTLWADGFNGVWQHLENRVPFVVVSPDELETQKKFYASRGWKFRMYSSHGTSFFRDMGFASDSNEPWPGVSTFQKRPDGTVVQVAHAYFGPGDDFCSVWPLLDLLPQGPNGWEPKYTYRP